MDLIEFSVGLFLFYKESSNGVKEGACRRLSTEKTMPSLLFEQFNSNWSKCEYKADLKSGKSKNEWKKVYHKI